MAPESAGNHHEPCSLFQEVAADAAGQPLMCVRSGRNVNGCFWKLPAFWTHKAVITIKAPGILSGALLIPNLYLCQCLLDVVEI